MKNRTLGGVIALVLVASAVSAPLVTATSEHEQKSHDNKQHVTPLPKVEKSNDKEHKNKSHGKNVRVTLCHKTGSAKNPYVVITVSANSIVKGKAHGAHHDHGDIIPPFTDNHGVKFAGMNWTSANQAIYNNNCKAVATETEKEDKKPVVVAPVEKPSDKTPADKTPATKTPVDTTKGKEVTEAPVATKLPENLPRTGAQSAILAIIATVTAAVTTAASYVVRSKLTN